MPFNNLQTPALILDRAALQRNLDAMHSRMQRLGVALRPHLKTAKSADIARLVTQGQAGGVTYDFSVVESLKVDKHIDCIENPFGPRPQMANAQNLVG